MGYKVEGGRFKPEEATDRLTCPCVGRVGGIRVGIFQGSGGEAF